MPLLLLGVWRRDQLRVVAFGLNLLFQVGIWSLVSIGVFQPLMILSVFPYLPGRLWDRVPGLRVGPGLGDGIERDASPLWLRRDRRSAPTTPRRRRYCACATCGLTL